MEIIPLPQLRGDKVALRPLCPDDFEALYSVGSDPLIWEQHPNPDRYQRQAFGNYFEGAIRSQGAYLITDAFSEEVLGSSRYYDFNATERTLKIGYTFFARHCWGKGYNRDAKIVMLTHAFQFVDRVAFEVGALNRRSQVAMERLGAVMVGEQEVAYFGEPPRLNVLYEIRREKLPLVNPAKE